MRFPNDTFIEGICWVFDRTSCLFFSCSSYLRFVGEAHLQPIGALYIRPTEQHDNNQQSDNERKRDRSSSLIRRACLYLRTSVLRGNRSFSGNLCCCLVVVVVVVTRPIILSSRLITPDCSRRDVSRRTTRCLSAAQRIPDRLPPPSASQSFRN